MFITLPSSLPPSFPPSFLLKSLTSIQLEEFKKNEWRYLYLGAGSDSLFDCWLVYFSTAFLPLNEMILSKNIV